MSTILAKNIEALYDVTREFQNIEASGNIDAEGYINGETIAVNGQEVIDQDGNITCRNLTAEVISELEVVRIADNKINLNSDLIGEPSSSLTSGVSVNRGNQPRYEFLFYEADNSFRIGQVGDMQHVATRQANPANDGIAYWNTIENRFVTSAYLTPQSIVLRDDFNVEIDELETTLNNTIANLNTTIQSSKENAITAGTTSQYWRGDKSWQTLNQAAIIGLTISDTPVFSSVRLAGLTTNGILRTTGANGTMTIDTNVYLTGNQAITLSGAISGSGTTSISTTLANNIVGTSNVIDSSITLAKLVNIGALTVLANTSGISSAPSAVSISSFKTALGLVQADIGGLTASSSPTFAGLNLTALTANTILAANASNNIVSLATATYPTLTEFSFVKGVTSAIQTQINNKENSIASGTIGQYWRGDKSWQTLNQAAIIGLTISDTPVFSSVRLAGLTTNGFLRTSSANGTLTVDTNTYLTANQAITLSGAISGTGTTSITATLANNIVGTSNLVDSSVTLAKLANIGASTVLANTSGISSAPSAVSISSFKTALGLVQSDISGLTASSSPTFSNVTLSSLGSGLVRSTAGAISVDTTVYQAALTFNSPLSLSGTTVSFGSLSTALTFTGGLNVISNQSNWEIKLGNNVGPNTSGNANNILIGNSVATALTSTSNNNVIIGGSAFGNITSNNSNNVVIGHSALSLGSSTSGLSNIIAIGSNAGSGLTIASNDVIIGSNTAQLIHGSTTSASRHWSPAADNAVDLGLSNRRWRNAHFAGDINLSNSRVTVNQTTTGGSTPIDPMIVVTNSTGSIGLNAACGPSVDYTRIGIQGRAAAFGSVTRTWRTLIDWETWQGGGGEEHLTDCRFYTHTNDASNAMIERMRITNNTAATAANNATIMITGGLGVSNGAIIAGTVRFSSLTSNGVLRTSSANGTLTVDTATYLTANQTITLSGAITGSGTTTITTTLASNSVNTANIVNNAVTLTKLETIPTNQILGNVSASAASPLPLTASQVKTVLAIVQADVSGLTTSSSPTFSTITCSSTSAGLKLPSTTTGSVSGPASGTVIHNSSQNCISFSDGSNWSQLYANSIVNQQFYSNTTPVDVGPNAGWIQIASFNYTPKLANTSFVISFDTRYEIVGFGQDAIVSSITIDSEIPSIMRSQIWVNNSGGGTRSGTILPISRIYKPNQSSPTAFTIRIQINSSGNDTATFLAGGVCTVIETFNA